jgi:hypothetical protein
MRQLSVDLEHGRVVPESIEDRDGDADVSEDLTHSAIPRSVGAEHRAGALHR